MTRIAISKVIKRGIKQGETKAGEAYRQKIHAYEQKIQARDEEIQAREKETIIRLHQLELSVKTIAESMGMPFAKVQEVITEWEKENKNKRKKINLDAP